MVCCAIKVLIDVNMINLTHVLYSGYLYPSSYFYDVINISVKYETWLMSSRLDFKTFFSKYCI